MATKITMSDARLRDVRPYGWPEKKDTTGKTDLQGHEFEFAVTLRFKKFFSTGKQRLFKGSDDTSVIEWADKGGWGNPAAWEPIVADMPRLEWKERIRWYEVSDTGAWAFKQEDSVDMFEISPRAKTFQGLYHSSFARGWSDPWRWAEGNAITPYTNIPKPKNFDNLADKTAERISLIAKHFRDKDAPLAVILIDRPGLNKNPGGGKSMGGGGLSTGVTHGSRVRVIHFTLGFQGSGLSVRGTQILETQNGIPTICKFVKTGLDDAAVENTVNHARWRKQIHLTDYKAVGNWNFDV